MPDVEFTNLLGVLLVAVAAPLLLGFAPRVRMPAVVVEILAGAALGPSGPGLAGGRSGRAGRGAVRPGDAALPGRARDRRAPAAWRLLGISVLGYALSLGLGLGVGAAVAAAGWARSPALVAVTFPAAAVSLLTETAARRPGRDSPPGHPAAV